MMNRSHILKFFDFRISTISIGVMFALYLVGSITLAAAKDVPAMPVKGLDGVGINSLALWSAASQTYSQAELLEHFKPLEEMGFSHVILIACADWILVDGRCKRYFQDRDSIITAVKTLVENTDLHFVLALKPYKAGKENGRFRSLLQKSLETSREVQDRFVQNWVKIARELASVPRERLSFSILNEPEFEFPKPSNSKRKKWEGIASTTIKAIREISPDRVIIYEGIAKSSAFRRYKNGYGSYKYPNISSIIRPLPFQDIVYGIHYYQPFWFVQQHKNFAGGSYGKPYSKRVRSVVSADARSLAKWAKKHNVPVILSETGCVGYLDGKTQGPKSEDGCPNFARDLRNEFVDKGIAISWFGLEKEKTIYVRKPSDIKTWMPASMTPNKKLLMSLTSSAK